LLESAINHKRAQLLKKAKEEMKKHVMVTTLALLVLSACSPVTENVSSAEKPTPVAGADRDAHGCMGSAGYTWSEVREACIRVFEAGLAFAPDETKTTAADGAVLQAFVVLAPEAGETITAAEAYVPGRTTPIALTVVHTPEGDIRPTVLVNKAEGLEVFSYKDEFILDVKGRRFRRQSAPDDRLFLIR
jgi:hypothetical protein